MAFDRTQLKSCGEDVVISSQVEIKRPQLVSIGHHVAIDSGFYCTVAAEIGDYIHIAPYVTAIGGAQGFLKLGHFSTLAAGTRIVCVSDEHHGEGLVGPVIPDKYRDRLVSAPVIIERFANVGTNVVILPGVTLGEGCVIVSCSMVTQSTQPWTIYSGIPARPVKLRPKDKMLAMATQMGYQ